MEGIGEEVGGASVAGWDSWGADSVILAPAADSAGLSPADYNTPSVYQQYSLQTATTRHL